MVSTQQYLCPDFMSPLPASIDSGKSPLELLAKTCNNIGLPDPPATKPTKSGTVAEGKTSSTNDTSTAATKSSGKSQEGKNSSKSSSSHSHGHHSSGEKDSHTGSGDTVDSHSKKEVKSADKSIDPIRSNSTDNNRSASRSPAKSGKDSQPSTSSHTETSGNSGRKSGQERAVGSPADKTGGGQSLPPTLPQPGSAPKCNGCLPSSYPLFPHLIPTSSGPPLMGFPPGYPHSLSGYSNGSYPTSSVLSAGIPPFFPMCRDPNCRSCPGSTGNSRQQSCPLGCPQCATGAAHTPADLWWLSSAAAAGYPMFGLGPSQASALGSTPLASLYSHAAAAAAAANSSVQQQHICNWMVGGDYCGKRFNSAAELLDHLRTHTSHDSTASLLPGLSNAALLAASNPALYSFAQGPTGAHLAGGGGRLSPRSTYLSSLNALSAARFHPYKSLTSPGSNSHLGFPGLSPSVSAAAYPFSALYGAQRSHPHS